MGKAGKILVHNGREYDSNEEIYFTLWMDELVKAGYIKKWIRNEDSFQITPPAISRFFVKKKEKTQTILQDLEYTPDFIIHWDTSAIGLFCNFLNKEKITQPFICQMESDVIISIVEIKPSFDRNNMTRLFRHTQKVFYHFFQKYVNLIIIDKLFDKTFTPTDFLITKTGKTRTISKWKIKTLDEYKRNNKH
jgi:WD40 repeat protein